MCYACQRFGLTCTCADVSSRHIKEVHFVNDFTCSICHKSFESTELITMHVKDDHNLKRMSGSTKCSVRFSLPENLDTHAKDIHVKQKSFKCSEYKNLFYKSNICRNT